ncbi:MAG TPA: hypothetical protein PK156_10150 [Polyangium sp.]|nr:hypothetical protein [Polyangium sp.]
MKRLVLGLSTANIVVLAAATAMAQPAAPPPPSPIESPTNPAPPNPPSAINPAAPQWSPQSPLLDGPPPPPPPPNSGSLPPGASNPLPYPPYGYANPYGGNPWGLPNQPAKEMPYRGGPIPNGYRYEEKHNLGLLIAGPVLFSIVYGVTAYSAKERTGAGSNSNGFTTRYPWDTLYVPVMGPFFFAAYAPEGSGFIYALEGLTQVTAIGLLLGGIFRTSDVLVRKEPDEAFRPTLHIGLQCMQLEMHF